MTYPLGLFFVKPAGGIYVLLIEVRGELSIGALGRQKFDGLYAYVGSAQGPGGFKRVARHCRVASGRAPARRWHIDRLLQHGRLEAVFIRETADPGAECALAAELGEILPPAVPGFGSSDCRCPTHLFGVPAVEVLTARLAARGFSWPGPEPGCPTPVRTPGGHEGL